MGGGLYPSVLESLQPQRAMLCSWECNLALGDEVYGFGLHYVGVVGHVEIIVSFNQGLVGLFFNQTFHNHSKRRETAC